MRQLTLLCLLFCISFSSFGQLTSGKNSTIEVVGSATIKVRPDIGTLIISVSSQKLGFGETVIGLNNKTKDISKQITQQIGFKESDLKTTDFTINKHTVYRRDERVDSGYIATQSIQVDFKNEAETITKILNTFSKSQTDFTLSFAFKLSDDLKDKVQKEVLKLAVRNAKEKAKLISETSEVRLKKVKTINYGYSYHGGMEELRNKASDGEMYASAASGEAPLVGFTPEDLIFIDAVVMSWEIK